MSSPASTTERFHALDALRAAMMFLGIYLHAVVAYSPNGGWPWRQPELTRTLDWSISVIHVFRMPIFYAMAGFFTALLLARYGMRRAAWNRFMRIVVPFVVGWIVVCPLVLFLGGLGYVGLERTLAAFASGYVLRFAGPMHALIQNCSQLKHKFAFQAVRQRGICGNFCSSGVEMPQLRQALHDLQAGRRHGGAVKIQRLQLIQASQGRNSSIRDFGFS